MCINKDLFLTGFYGKCFYFAVFIITGHFEISLLRNRLTSVITITSVASLRNMLYKPLLFRCIFVIWHYLENCNRVLILNLTTLFQKQCLLCQKQRWDLHPSNAVFSGRLTWYVVTARTTEVCVYGSYSYFYSCM